MLLDATATPFPRQTWLEGNVARKQPLFISTPDYKSLDVSQQRPKMHPQKCKRGVHGLADMLFGSLDAEDGRSHKLGT